MYFLCIMFVLQFFSLGMHSFYFPIATSHGFIVTIHTFSNEDNNILDREIEAAEISR